MKSEDLDKILELRESDDCVSADSPKRSLGWRVTLMLIVLISLGATLAPMGIMMLLYQVGIHTGGGGSEQGIVVGFLMVCAIAGFVSICASNPRVFKYVFFILLGLAILNLSGCSVILKGLSNIH